MSENGTGKSSGYDKISKAQDAVTQASKAMQDNVRSIINNQAEISVSIFKLVKFSWLCLGSGWKGRFDKRHSFHNEDKRSKLGDGSQEEEL